MYLSNTAAYNQASLKILLLVYAIEPDNKYTENTFKQVCKNTRINTGGKLINDIIMGTQFRCC